MCLIQVCPQPRYGRWYTIATTLLRAFERKKLQAILHTAATFVLFFSVSLSTIATQAQSKSGPVNDALVTLGTLKSKKITESSGLAQSHYIENAWWTMNDSGHGTEVFLFGNQGQTFAVCKLKEANNRDWEAMSSFQSEGKHFLMVADVGDNVARRARCQLYIFEEPKFKPKKKKSFSKKLTTRMIEFRYEDGPRNCEAVACERDGESVYLIEKIFLETNKRRHPGIYKLALPVKKEAVAAAQQSTPLVAKRIGSFPFRGVTGMAISPNGKRLAIRNYLTAHIFERGEIDGKLPTWQSVFQNSKPKSFPMPLQVQGEAICFTSDNEHVILTSETARQAIWKVRVPPLQESNEAAEKHEPEDASKTTDAIERPVTPLKTIEAQ